MNNTSKGQEKGFTKRYKKTFGAIFIILTLVLVSQVYVSKLTELYILNICKIRKHGIGVGINQQTSVTEMGTLPQTHTHRDPYVYKTKATL